MKTSGFGIHISKEDLQTEIWKPVPDFPLLLISNKGRIAKLKSQYAKSSNRSKKLYFYGRYGGTGTKQFKISRLVATVFIRPPKAGEVANHLNGDTNNNKVENLEWCTISENNKHAYRIGLKKPSNQFIKARKLTLV